MTCYITLLLIVVEVDGLLIITIGLHSFFFATELSTSYIFVTPSTNNHRDIAAPTALSHERLEHATTAARRVSFSISFTSRTFAGLAFHDLRLVLNRTHVPRLPNWWLRRWLQPWRRWWRW